MKHRVGLLLLVVILLLFGSVDASAAPAGEWPAYHPDPAAGADFRGPGYYFGLTKIISCWLLFVIWVGTADWISRDVQTVRLRWDYRQWNPIVVGSFFLTLLLFWWIPYFWLGFALLLIGMIAPPTTYILVRNSEVTNDQRVLTPAHLRYVMATWLKPVGVKIDAEARDPHESGPPVKVHARGGADDRENNARLIAARQMPGLRDARQIIADGLAKRSDSILLDYTQQGVGVRYQIDGVWHPREPEERETADPALEALKTLCALKPEDRTSRQEGTFGVEHGGIRYEATLASAGTKTGERVLLQFVDPKVHFTTLDELGIRPKMQEQLLELLGAERGLVILSAIPDGGLRTTIDVVLNKLDRFTREFVAVEEASERHEEVENIPVTTFDKSQGQSPPEVLTKLMRMDPNVIVMRDLVDGDTLSLLCDEINNENRLLITTTRAKESSEAVLRVMSLGVAGEKYAKAVTGALNQRLIRKLCPGCKEAYTPPPQVLQQLGIPPGRIQAFYRPPQQPEEVCEQCGGIGYLGRMALCELLVVGQNTRAVLASGPKLELVRKAARKDGMRTLQEEGILLVAKGVTSLPELMRVLKG